ncbi:tetratricopeptide repeat protein [Niabella sp. CJ426]|uniref:tetratricopeptide repeat protein n=1 Tax=Niabella sp. CJ426 TaxID=3393740 RepID=UPI003CFDF78B
MKKTILFLLLLAGKLSAQPVCSAFLYMNDTLQYKACKLVENIDERHYQFSKEFQILYDSALALCPHFSWGYREKSVAYLKSGDFITWKKLIDKAVQYDTLLNLGYRAWCRYEFFRDCEGAIADIELLETKTPEIGWGINGNYHLTVTKAICHSELGQQAKAISVLSSYLRDAQPIGLYDYYQLGAIHYKNKDYAQAATAFQKQIEYNNLAEAHYYLSLIYKGFHKDILADQELLRAKQLKAEGKKLRVVYTHHSNTIFF